MNWTKPFNSGLGKYMRKAACHLGVVDSLNPHRWRGERLHHHGGGVCWLFVLLWMDSWWHKLIVCKKWYKNNLKMRLMALLFDPPRHAPHLLLLDLVVLPPLLPLNLTSSPSSTSSSASPSKGQCCPSISSTYCQGRRRRSLAANLGPRPCGHIPTWKEVEEVWPRLAVREGLEILRSTGMLGLDLQQTCFFQKLRRRRLAEIEIM